MLTANLEMARQRGAEIGKRLAIEALRRPLYQAVGCHLAGREIDLKIKPTLTGGPGCMYINSRGIPVIEIDPDLSEEKSLWVFLHELAHVVLHAGEMPENPIAEVSQPGTFKAIHDSGEEDQTDGLAVTWLNYSKAYLYKYDPGKSKSTRQLLALRDK